MIKQKKMNQKYVFIVLLAIILAGTILPLASASLGTYQQNSCVDIKTILNTTAANISSLSWPNSTAIITNRVMNKTGYTFNYTFCSTRVEGTYVYDYVDAIGNVYVNNFIVTPTGDTTSNTFFVVFCIISVVLLLLAYVFKNTVFAFLSGLAFLVTGVYTMINGFGDVTTTYTYIVAVIIIGLGAILAITSALDFMDETYGGGGESEE